MTADARSLAPLRTFPGYDPLSPTLQPSPLVGTCMWGVIPREYVTCWTDRSVEIRSGDFVRLHIAYDDGIVAALVKGLRVSRAGTWWAECSDGIFQVGTLVRPSRIEKVVALDTEPLIHTPGRDRDTPSPRAASAHEARHFAELAREVVEEWATLGHVDGVPFPGLHRVNYRLHDGSPNPEYRSPEPL